jgi:hypothetical protein
MLEHVVIGMGMSSLGVVEGLVENNKSILVVDIPKKVTEYAYVNDSKIPLGQIGLGGNSELWHGVISYLGSNSSKEFKNIFNFFFNKYYPRTEFILNKGFSFIPNKPLRPKKIIEKKFKNNVSFLYKELLSIEIFDNFVKLYFNDKTLTTKYLWLCTGASGTFNILRKSNYLNLSEEYLINDHLVGYFGQIKRKDLPVSFNNIIAYNYFGHLKKFHIINLSSGKKMYLNLRPAHFSFKNIEIASKSRSFFSQNSTSIIKKLIFSLNFGLILEAFYNKFGISIKSNLYNIVGHIEINNSLKYSISKNSLEYLQAEVEFTDSDIKEINEYFGCLVDVKNKVSVSPGIHFMNLKKNLKNIKIDDNLENEYNDSNVILCSGLALKKESPEHPTFSLLIYSYMKVKSFLLKTNL